MRLRTALLAATALVAATDAARAEPISTAIGLTTAITSLGASVATAGAIGGAIIGTALSVGASLLLSAFRSKPKAGEAATGVEMSVQLGGDVPRQIPVGRCSLKGQLVYQNTSGYENALLEQVFVLSDWPIGGLAELWLGGQKRPIQLHSSGPGWAHWLLTEFPGQASVVVYDGTQTDADGSLVANSNPPGRWTANSRLTGLAYAKLNLIYNKYSTLYEDGVPSFSFVVDGAKLYDRRKDDTAGGVGPQRWNDPSTWTPSANPAVIRENYLRGFWRAGELLLGMGVPGYDLVGDSFVAAANACDETVPKADGGTEPRYRCGTVLTADEGMTHQEILGVLDSTDAGELFEAAGLYVCQAGVAQGVVRTITDDDLVLGEPVSYAGKRSRAELVNGVHGQFLDPASGYQPQDYVARISAAGEIADGGPLRKGLDQLSTASQSQAERVAEIRLRQARAQATGSIPLPYQHRDLIPGDWIRWTSKRFDGVSLTSKVFRIPDRQVAQATKIVRLSLEEISASVYSWSSGEEGEPVPVVVPPGPPLLPSVVQGFALQAFQIIAGDGVTQLPGIKATWTPITDPTVDNVVVQLRPVGATSVLPFVDPSPEDGELTIAGGLAPGTAYEGRAILQTTPPRPVDWTPWRPVSTGEARFDIDLGDVDDKVRLLIEQALANGDNQQWAELLAGSVTGLGAQVRAQHGLVLERVAELTEKTSSRIDETDQALAETRKQLRAGTDRTAAQYDAVVELAAAAESASARRLEALQSSVVSGDAHTATLIANEAQTRNSQTTALAQRSSVLEATVLDGENSNTNIRASLTDFQRAQGTLNEATSSSVTSLNTRVGANESAVSSVGQALNTATSALGLRVDTVEAKADGASASGRRSTLVSIGPDGTTVVLEDRVSRTVGGQTFTGGRYLLIKEDGTVQEVVDADKFFIGKVVNGQLISSKLVSYDAATGTFTVPNLVVEEELIAPDAVAAFRDFRQPNDAFMMQGGFPNQVYTGDVPNSSRTVSIKNSAWLDIQAFVPILVQGQFNYPVYFTVYLDINGQKTVVNSASGVSNIGTIAGVLQSIRQVVPAGTYNIKLTWQYSQGGGFNTNCAAGINSASRMNFVAIKQGAALVN